MPGTLEVRETDVQTAREHGTIPLGERATRGGRVDEDPGTELVPR